MAAQQYKGRGKGSIMEVQTQLECVEENTNNMTEKKKGGGYGGRTRRTEEEKKADFMNKQFGMDKRFASGNSHVVKHGGRVYSVAGSGVFGKKGKHEDKDYSWRCGHTKFHVSKAFRASDEAVGAYLEMNPDADPNAEYYQVFVMNGKDPVPYEGDHKLVEYPKFNQETFDTIMEYRTKIAEAKWKFEKVREAITSDMKRMLHLTRLQLTTGKRMRDDNDDCAGTYKKLREDSDNDSDGGSTP